MDVSSKETVNSFNGGLNTDIDNSLIPKNQYRDALNMRVVGSRDSSASTLQPYTGFNRVLIEDWDTTEVISTINVRDYIVSFIINTTNNVKYFNIYRYSISDGMAHPLRLLTSETLVHDYDGASKFSCVARYEDSDNIKVYWADGINPIRSINVANGFNDETLLFNRSITNVDQFNIKPLTLIDKPKFESFGSGSLKCGKIQYSYYFYNKNGQQTELSVPSELISLSQSLDTQSNKYNIKGDTSDTSSNKSVNISIPINGIDYSRVKIISIYYSDNSSSPVINTVGDLKIDNTESTFYFTDYGNIVLNTYTIDEFNLLTGINFSAKYIESKNNYLFAGNITNIDWDLSDTVYDTRAYRSNIAGYSLLKSSTGDDLKLKIRYHNLNYLGDNVGEILDSETELPVDVPLTHDCINPYNDLNKDVDLTNGRFTTATTIDSGLANIVVTYSGDKTEEDDKYAFYTEEVTSGGIYKKRDIRYGGVGKNIKYEFIWSDVELEDNWITTTSPSTETVLKSTGTLDGKLTNLTKKDFEGMWHYDQNKSAVHSSYLDGGVTKTKKLCDYSNTYIDLKYKSLHRDEIYRYGIVFYNKYGVKSTTKWIGDIRTPHIKEEDIFINDTITPKNNYNFSSFLNNEFISFTKDGIGFRSGLIARPLGIRFTLMNLETLQSEGVTAYEIVRVKRTINDKSTLSQGYVSKVFNSTISGDNVSGEMKDYVQPYIYPIFTQGILSGTKYLSYPENVSYNGYTGNVVNTNMKEDGILQFVSPDTAYSNASFYDSLLKLNLFGSITNILYCINNTKSNGFYSNVNTTSIDGDFTEIVNNISSGTITDIGTLFYDLATTSKPGLTISKYYGQIYQRGFTGVANIIGKKTDDFESVKESIDLLWNDTTDRIKKYTNVGDKNVINWCYDSTYSLDETYYSKYAANGPSTSSLYIKEPTTGTLNLSKGYTDSSITAYIQKHLTSLPVDTTVIVNNSTSNPVTINSTFRDYHKISNTFSNYYRSHFEMMIINLKHFVTPYGGQTYNSRQYTTYTSIGCIESDMYSNLPVSHRNIDTFNGDTYICIFDNQRCHASYVTTMDDKGYNARKSVNFQIPVETSYNLCLTHGDEIHRGANFNAQIEPADVSGHYTQTEPMYLYNSAYSAISDVVIDTVRNELDELNKNLDTRIVYSEQKINDEIQDSWTIFKTNNFLELDNRYGALTNLKLFKNQLLAFQENALSQLAVKERTVLQDNNIGGLVLGTGDILERYDYITTNYGIAPDQSKVIIDTESALYWFDHYRNQILGYNGQLDLLSKKKYIQSYLNTHTIKDYPIAVYNRELNDVMFNLFTDTVRPTIAFNEQIDGFSSFYSIDYISGNNVNGKLYLFKDSTVTDLSYSIIEYSDTKVVDNKTVNNINEFLDGKKHDSSITYVVNEGYDQTKIFDNVEFNGLYPFTHTEIQYDVDGKKTYTLDSSDIQNRELTYKYAIPRIVSGEDIPDRVRGKATTCTFTITPDGKLFRIPYFKTKFRTSKS